MRKIILYNLNFIIKANFYRFSFFFFLWNNQPDLQSALPTHKKHFHQIVYFTIIVYYSNLQYKVMLVYKTCGKKNNKSHIYLYNHFI